MSRPAPGVQEIARRIVRHSLRAHGGQLVGGAAVGNRRATGAASPRAAASHVPVLVVGVRHGTEVSRTRPRRTKARQAVHRVVPVAPCVAQRPARFIVVVPHHVPVVVRPLRRHHATAGVPLVRIEIVHPAAPRPLHDRRLQAVVVIVTVLLLLAARPRAAVHETAHRPPGRVTDALRQILGMDRVLQ